MLFGSHVNAPVKNNLHAVLSGHQQDRPEDVSGSLQGASLVTKYDDQYIENEEVARAYPWHRESASSMAKTTRTVTGGQLIAEKELPGPTQDQIGVIMMTGAEAVPVQPSGIFYTDTPDVPTIYLPLPEGAQAQMDRYRLFTDEGTVPVYAQSSSDVAHLKDMCRLQLYLSPRLELMLQPAQGYAPLPDNAPIRDYSRSAATNRANPGRPGEITHARHSEPDLIDDLSLSSRPLPLSDFDVVGPAAPPPDRIRVRPCKGGQPYPDIPAMLVRGIQPRSTVNDVKRAMLTAAHLFPGIEQCGGELEKLQVYFSQVFFTPDVLLGRRARSALPGIATLASCKLVRDDILYVEYAAGDAFHKPSW